MLRDIYAIPNSEGRYKPGIVELNNELDEILQQVDCLLFTRKGEVLMMPDFGCDLHKYLFDTNWNKSAIKHMIESQIIQRHWLKWPVSLPRNTKDTKVFV